MSTLLDDISSLEEIINSLVKMESKMRSGQFIDAYRECCRLFGVLSEHKRELLKKNLINQEKKSDK